MHRAASRADTTLPCIAIIWQAVNNSSSTSAAMFERGNIHERSVAGAVILQTVTGFYEISFAIKNVAAHAIICRLLAIFLIKKPAFHGFSGFQPRGDD